VISFNNIDDRTKNKQSENSRLPVNESKHVLMVIPSYYPSVGGAEQQLFGLTDALVKIGQSTAVVTRKLKGCSSFEVLHYTDVYRLPWKPYPFIFLAFLAWYLFTNRKKYRLIHVHTLNSPFLLCAFWGGISGTPVVAKVTRTGRGSQIGIYQANSYRRWLFAAAAKYVTKFIAVTEDVKTILGEANVPSSKICRIPNGVTIPSREKRQVGQVVRICFVGRLIARKKTDWLIRSVAELREEGRLPQCKINIIGDGPERLYLERLAAETRLSGVVSFFGRLDPGKVKDILYQQDCFVLPSESEGMSNALLEAMALGLVVIAANIPANREVIEAGKNGLLFTEMAELKAHIEVVCSNPMLVHQLAANGRSTIKQRFSMEKVAVKYADLYRRM